MLTAAREDELVAACMQGDEGAASELVDGLWDRVFAFSYRLTLNRSDAEDVTQETFLRALKNLAGYKPEKRFKAWLFRIATNLYLDQKKSSRSKDVVTTQIECADHADADPAQQEANRELLAALQEAMAELSPEQRLVVHLRTVEHMDYPEIASMLQTKEATARWHLFEARRILKQKLSRRFDLEALADE